MKGRIKEIFIPCPENNYRPKFLDGRVLFYYVILILILKLSLFPFFILFNRHIFFATISREAIIQLINQSREELGLNPLNENPKLNQAAYLKANDMLKRDYFSHQTPEGVWAWDLLKKVGYNYRLAGENLAIGFLDSEEVYRAWMNSPSHKSNILNPQFNETGIAVLKGEFEGNETTVIVQLFGSPKAVPPVVSTKEPKPSTSVKVSPKLKKTTPTEAETRQKTEVLSKESLVSSPEIIPQIKIETPINKKENLVFNFLNFVAVHYNSFVQKLIYGSLVFIIISLLINIFVRFDIQHKDLILKTSGFVVLLILFLWLDKIRIIELIPHKLFIYEGVFFQ
jgi:hypothetical protein